MQFITLLFTLLAATAYVLAFHHNGTAGDGVYTHYFGENGLERTIYVGRIGPRGTPSAASAETTPASSASPTSP